MCLFFLSNHTSKIFESLPARHPPGSPNSPCSVTSASVGPTSLLPLTLFRFISIIFYFFKRPLRILSLLPLCLSTQGRGSPAQVSVRACDERPAVLVCPLLSDAGTGPSSPDCLSTSHCSGCMVNFGAVADVKKKGLIQVIKRHVKKKTL